MRTTKGTQMVAAWEWLMPCALIFICWLALSVQRFHSVQSMAVARSRCICGSMVFWLVVASALFVFVMTAFGAEPPRAMLAEDFDGTWQEGRWRFYDGHEFPGARGAFSRSQGGHEGRCGRLDFDFTGGGNYVSAVLKLENAPPLAAVQVWLKKPRGNKLTFRYTDQTGQTLQKGFFAPDETWAEVQIGFAGWGGHWGGANDGELHGPPREIAFLVENSGTVRGSLLMDDVRLIPGVPDASLGMLTGEYVAARFNRAEGWHSDGASGNPGTTVLEGNKWKFDFARGARWVVIRQPEWSLPGTPQQFRIRFRGRADGHKLEIHLATHFMVFANAFPVPAGDGEREIVFDAPPGAGWRWFNGENDGALHGPLRIAGLFLSADGKADSGVLELLEIRVKALYPPQRAWMLAAELRKNGAKSEFVGTLLSMAGQAKEATVLCAIRDWSGKTLSQTRREVTVPPGAAPVEIAVPVPPGEHKFLEAVLTAEAAGEMIPPAQAYLTAPLDEQRKPDLEPESPFGMGVYLYRYPDTAEGLRDMEKAALLAQNAGVKWSREEFHWARIERQKGQLDWSFYDKLVAAAKRHGISVYGILSYWSGWTKPYTPEGIGDYCRFAAAAAARYRNDIQHWEVWNEPNIFFWQGPPDMYADLLKQAYAAIKAASPDAKVLGCSTAGVDLRSIRRTMELGAPFDVLTIHPYRGTLYDPAFVANLKEAAELVKPRPVWITEMGWATHVAHNSMDAGFAVTTQRRQAELLARAYLDAIGSGTVPNMSWYNFRNDGDDPFNFENNLGILTRDFSPKPAYRAFAVMTRLLHGKNVAGAVDLGEGVIAYRFTAGSGDDGVTAIWTLYEDKTVELPGAGTMVLTDLMGDSQFLKSEKGKVRVDLRQEVPVFLQAGDPRSGALR